MPPPRLAHVLVPDDALDAALSRVVARGRQRSAALSALVELVERSLGRGDFASLLLVHRGRPVSGVARAPEAAALDRVQLETGDGPALDAVRQLQAFELGHARHARPWPAFCRMAEAMGVNSALFLPLTAGGEVLGSVNVYGCEPRAFDECGEAGLRLAAHVAAALAAGGLGLRPPLFPCRA